MGYFVYIQFNQKSRLSNDLHSLLPQGKHLGDALVIVAVSVCTCNRPQAAQSGPRAVAGRLGVPPGQWRLSTTLNCPCNQRASEIV